MGTVTIEVDELQPLSPRQARLVREVIESAAVDCCGSLRAQILAEEGAFLVRLECSTAAASVFEMLFPLGTEAADIEQRVDATIRYLKRAAVPTVCPIGSRRALYF